MRRTIATLGVVGLGVMAATVSANAAPPVEKKITICHATSSAANAFVAETINLSALKAHADDTLDIVPVNDGTIFPDGQNLSTDNLAFLASGCVAAAVPPVVPPADPPVDPPVDPPADPPVDPPADPPADPGTDSTPESAATPLTPAVVVPKSAAAAPETVVPAAKTVAPATKKVNVGYNVQTAVGRTSDTGIPTWLLALTGAFTAGAAAVLWSGGRRARNAEK